VPYPLFNDAMDTVRAAGVEFFPQVEPLSEEEEKERRLLPEEFQTKNLYKHEDIPRAIRTQTVLLSEAEEAEAEEDGLSSYEVWRRALYGERPD